jgi:hypothetical protein
MFYEPDRSAEIPTSRRMTELCAVLTERLVFGVCCNSFVRRSFVRSVMAMASSVAWPYEFHVDAGASTTVGRDDVST